VTGRAGALALIFATVVILQHFAGREAALSTVALALGFALIAASLLGELAEKIRLPRLSGYLIFGLLCGPFMLNLITASMARELQIVNGLAIALIAFVAGLELNLSRLRPRLRALLIVGGVIVFGMLAVFTAILWALWPWLPFGDPGGPWARLAAALVTSALIISFSPTVTIAVIAESRSRGDLTELVLATVVLADLLLIVVFALAMQLARGVTGFGLSEVPLIVQLSWEILGSLAFGAIAGALFALYLRSVGRELTLALLGLCATLAAATPALHFELILASLAAGLVVENIAPPDGDQLKDAVERGALPVLIVFFAAAGASLQLDALALVGLTALAIALARVALLRWFGHLGVQLAQLPETPGRLVWMGLVSQAGVTLGLATILAAEFPGWGELIQTIVVALTALHVLVGPMLFKAALQRAGEIGRMDAELSAALPGPAAAGRSASEGPS
jgi:Kef-type K+ transport system membrane component KefB